MITAENALLRIKRIRQSRNGAFCVADLITDFGEFKVKDPILEQFEEGEYEATVWISEIHLGQYIAYGKAVTEMRARLQDLQVHTEPVLAEDSEQLVQFDRVPAGDEGEIGDAQQNGEGDEHNDRVGGGEERAAAFVLGS